jgi:hypothetical protein
MRFTGATALRVEDGKIAEEIRLDDGVTALQQLGLLRTSSSAREGLEFLRVSIVGALQKSLRFHQNDPFLARGTDGSNPASSSEEMVWGRRRRRWHHRRCK